MGIALHFAELCLSPTKAPRLPAGANRVVYAREGEASIGGKRLPADEARFLSARETARLEGEGILWIWGVLGEGDERPLADGAKTKLAAAVRTLDRERESAFLLRCDSVAFPAGGCAYTHVHQGPGIRALTEGSIRIDSEGNSHLYGPGEAWFESGPQPVFAAADPALRTRFIRVMLLPLACKGKSSIRYILAEDEKKPKTQNYRGYCEDEIDLGAWL